MKLNSLRMCNFRQFRAEQLINFANTDGKQVTLYFGANGSGKTTLLNAFTWCLYGTLSEDMEGQNRLVTDSVWQEAQFGSTVTSWVEICFEHNGIDYKCRREVEGVKSSEQQKLESPRLTVWETLADGSTKEIIAGQQKIDTILPRRLSQFFFFNGERIEKLVKDNAYTEIKQAIKSLLGLEQVERAIEDLPRVVRRLQSDLKKHGGDEIAAITVELEEVRDKRAQAVKRLQQAERDVVAVRSEKQQVQDLLKQHAAAAPLQRQRDDLDRALHAVRKDIQLTEAAKLKLVSERGFLSFIKDLAENTYEIADGLSAKGQLPAPLKRDFVEALLINGTCLCGTPLAEGSSERTSVEVWRSKVGLAEVEARWMELRGRLSLMGDARTALESDIHQTRSRYTELRASLSDLQQKKTSVDAELSEMPLEDVQRLSDKQVALETRQSEMEGDIGAIKVVIESYIAQEDRLNNAFQKASIKDAMAERIRARLTVVKEVSHALQRILDIKTESVRADLDTRVKSVYKRVTVKPFVPILADNFELRLVHADDPNRRSVAKSTGENQILSLSFVAAVSELAAEYRNRTGPSSELMEEGGYFPVVMDAAFGSLDENYQKDISRALSTLAPQMVVFVSKSQGLGTVLRELNPHLGRLGVIVTHTTKAEDANEDIDLGGHSHRYIRTGDEWDYAELLEVF